MENLVIKTLKLGQLNSEKIEFMIDNINLWDEINNAIIQNKFLFKKNNVQTSNKVNRKIIVKADKLHLTELLNNLFSNAIKYSKKGGKLIIDAKDDKGFVTISIKDTGIGMTQDQIDHIFNEFYKADESRHNLDSSGLGLAISKKIIKKHDGKIWAESAGPGQGTTFFFTLKKSAVEHIREEEPEIQQ